MVSYMRINSIWRVNLETFYQAPPEIKNTFSDSLIFDLLDHLSEGELNSLQVELENFGNRVIRDYHPHSLLSEDNPPVHKSYDAWGNRVDEIVTHPSWKALHEMVAEDGVVACGYERKQKEFSRLYQMVRIMSLHPSSAFYTCPLAMTDGAARVLELNSGNKDLDKIFQSLVSGDKVNFWTSGQWMTEKVGGSDVANTETTAEKNENSYLLYGKKWFTSAVTSEISLALAQEYENKKPIGLSLFLVKLRDENGQLQNIEVQRLKDKLGTKALPTAELHLNGVPAQLIGQSGKGVKAISSILNITRIYNSACAVGTFHRGIHLAIDYANKRSAFGTKIIDHPLHKRTLGELKALCDANIHLLFFVSALLGKSEHNKTSDSEEAILRLLTPVLKLWTAKSTVQSVSEICESFGGAGYIEDTGIPRLLRDSQVFPIWEGTTNILSLDVLRVLSKPEISKLVLDYMEESLERLTIDKSLNVNGIKETFITIKKIIGLKSKELLELNARALSYEFARFFSLTSMYQLAGKSRDNKGKYVTSYKLFLENNNSPRVIEEISNLL